MRYVTINELNEMIRRNLWKIPHDIDLVVGIPRSGMLPADLIALYLNTRLSDIDSFAEGRVYSNGLTRGEYISEGEIKKVLVVDDSICSGNSLLKAKKKLEAVQDKNFEFVFCVPIATTRGAAMVDLCFEIIDEDRVFEWNLFHHGVLANACVDIDGVLCVDPVEDDDGEKYRSFIQATEPFFIPTCTINTLVSCRLEKYRAQTEYWLKNHGIDYAQLIMLDFPDKSTRLKWGRHGVFKGEYYKSRNDCVLFIESSFQQAKQIAEISNKPVYCVETNTMIHIQSITRKKRFFHAVRKRLPRGYHRLRKIYYGLGRLVSGSNT